MWVIYAVAAVGLLAVFYSWFFVRVPPLKERTIDEVDIKKNFVGKNIPDNVDIIVVGSGLGGLTAAALLAQQGNKVLVLEQHDVAGGCTHAFEEKGFEFDVGLHYVGGDIGNTKRQMGAMLSSLCSFPVEWADQGEIFDLAKFSWGEVPMRKGFKNYRKTLLAEFPDESAAIDKYLDLIRKTTLAYGPSFVWRILPAFIAKYCDFLRGPSQAFSNKTLQNVLDEVGASPRLQDVLSYVCGDYGLPPNRSSWLIHAMVVAHYYHGGFYPVGGASVLAKAIVPTIERFGGAVLVRAKVTTIMMEHGHVAGVAVEHAGKIFELRAPTVISAVGIPNTALRLLPPEGQKLWPEPLKWLQSRDELPVSAGHLNMFVGLDGDSSELNLPKYNTWWFMRDAPINKLVDDYYSHPGPVPEVPFMFVGFPSAKDPSYAARYPGKSTCTVVTEAPFRLFEEWKDGKVRHRGDEYDAVKENIKEQILEKLYEAYPQLKGRVRYCELGTPVTNNYYLNSVAGESYGIEHTPERFALNWLRPKTPIPGLWITGQDLVSCGIGGALAAGYMTACAMDMRVLVKNAYKMVLL